MELITNGEIKQNSIHAQTIHRIINKHKWQHLRNRHVLYKVNCTILLTAFYHKKITLSLRWPCDAPNMWVPWKL